ncbi:hypothetical protein MTP99_003885 [Tenebrio molitor]|nr:hypothetical protein MTP99_003885 [Tenebrio molitor]
MITIIKIYETISSKKYMMTYRNLTNWAFLARFCFLSEEGQFEYFLEFNEDQGVPNLLLYYDTDNQWPAVYKTAKDIINQLKPESTKFGRRLVNSGNH